MNLPRFLRGGWINFKKREESEDFLASCMQMTWICVVSIEEHLRAMVGHFAEVCRRRGLKDNSGKSKVMVLGGDEELECEICVDAIRLEHVSEFKYLGYVLEESGTNEPESSRKVASRRRVIGEISSLVNARSLQLEYTRVLH